MSSYQYERINKAICASCGGQGTVCGHKPCKNCDGCGVELLLLAVALAAEEKDVSEQNLLLVLKQLKEKE